jgi:hypothetical protein
VIIGTEKDFSKEKAALLDLVNSLSAETIRGERHPVFGKLTKENRSKATRKHPDHHLWQFGV